MRIIFFDTETTGKSDTDRLCQLAIKERGVSAPVVNAIYKPAVPISIQAMAIHHITEKVVAERPSFQESGDYSRIKTLFEDPNTVAVAHNAPFDITMLARDAIVPTQFICTYKVAYSLDPEEKLEQYTLQYLRYFLGLEIDAVAHDAWGDVLVLEGLFERLFAKMQEKTGSEEAALNEMIKISAQPLLLKSFNFGKKHKGEKVADVAKTDRSYLEWLLTEKRKAPNGEENWIYTLEHYLI